MLDSRMATQIERLLRRQLKCSLRIRSGFSVLLSELNPIRVSFLTVHTVVIWILSRVCGTLSQCVIH